MNYFACKQPPGNEAPPCRTGERPPGNDRHHCTTYERPPGNAEHANGRLAKIAIIAQLPQPQPQQQQQQQLIF
eukprot:2545656-Prorocentrum_lima.AAC.1